MPRILVVEDNEMNRDMLCRRLARRGYETVVAVDGQEGFSMAHSTCPDLVLMDLGLPEIDGWQAARLLKADPATRHLPVIALSAHTTAGDKQRAIEAGCDDFDSKPVDLPRLLGKIGALLPRAEDPERG